MILGEKNEKRRKGEGEREKKHKTETSLSNASQWKGHFILASKISV